MDLHAGETFGEHRIIGVVGARSTGRVYQVEHLLTKRVEAMKILSSELATETQIKRFEREMRALARLHHPNIAALHNAVHVDNKLILLVEYVEGQTLEDMFRAGQLPRDVGLEYVRQILQALKYAHEQGVVHRDITPANVIVTPTGEVKLIDFGLSKSFGDSLLSVCGEVLGSLPYLAPEQLKGVTQPDPRSDLYSTGAILYEHLTGQNPFGADRKLAPVITDSEAEPLPPSRLAPGLAPRWDEITLRAIAREPVRRYQSAGEFLDALTQVVMTPEGGLQAPSLRPTGAAVLVIASVLMLFAAPSAVDLATASVPRPSAIQHHMPPPDFAWAKTANAAMKVRRRVQSPRIEAKLVESQPASKEAEEPVAFREKPEPKKNFWSKLNVFKKRKSLDAQ